MFQDLNEFIVENEEAMIITGGVAQEKVAELEAELGVEFRSDLKAYLGNYGLLMGYGIEMLGCGIADESSIVRETKRFREQGLSDEYIVIRNADEWIYCLNNNDGTVSSWDTVSKEHLKKADSFEEYVLRELIDAKDEWDE